jgi:sterol desaturase/sphingolipid hydroxylase (fatty acid hydroxylase superfamily)
LSLTATQIALSAAVGGSALLLVALERRIPYNPGQRLFRPGFFTDLLLYNFFQSYVLGFVIAALISWIDTRTGFSRLRLLAPWPVPAQIGFFLVTHDLYIYGFHRLQHRSRLLWRIHEAHHSVSDVDWLSGARSHALEILINQTIEFAPIVLLGAAPEVALWKGAISAVWGMFIHSNLNVRLGALQRLINGPEMHRWHHALDPEAYQKNFATKLAVWDWIFRTAYFPDPALRKASRYGSGNENFPRTFWNQQLYAFRRWKPRPSHGSRRREVRAPGGTSPSFEGETP